MVMQSGQNQSVSAQEFGPNGSVREQEITDARVAIHIAARATEIEHRYREYRGVVYVGKGTTRIVGRERKRNMLRHTPQFSFPLARYRKGCCSDGGSGSWLSVIAAGWLAGRHSFSM